MFLAEEKLEVVTKNGNRLLLFLVIDVGRLFTSITIFGNRQNWDRNAKTLSILDYRSVFYIFVGFFNLLPKIVTIYIYSHPFGESA